MTAEPSAGRQGALRLLYVGMGCVTLTFSMLNVLVPLAAIAFGASPYLVGALVSSGHVLPMLLGIPLGRLVDRSGGARIMTFGALGSITLPVAFVAWPGLVTLGITQLASGLFHVCLAVASQSLVASLGTQRTHERNFASYSTYLSAGQLIGPIVAGVLLDAAGYRIAFAALAVSGAITAVAVLNLRRTGLLGIGTAETGSAHRTTDLRTLFANVGVQLAILGSCGVLTAIAVRQAFMPPYLVEHQFTATAIGALLSLRAVAAVVVRPLMPQIIRALGGRARTLFVMMAVVAVGVGALGLSTSYAVLAVLALLAGIGTGIGMPLSIVTIASHVGARDRGAALALRMTVNRAAQLVAPFVMGVVVSGLGYGPAFLATGVALLVLALLALRLAPAFDAIEAAQGP